MNNNFTINNYGLVRFDPRVKLVILCILTTVSFMAINNTRLIFYSFLVIVLWLLLGDYKEAFKIFIFYTTMFLFACIMNQMPNNHFVVIINHLNFFLLRLPIFFFMGTWFLKNMCLGELIASLEAIHIPKGFIIALSVVFRFLPTVKKEFRTISYTMRQRNIGINNLFLHPLRTVEYVMVPIILRSLTIADELSTSSITRGLDTQRRRSTIFQVHFKIKDLIMIVLIALYLILSIYISNRIEVNV